MTRFYCCEDFLDYYIDDGPHELPDIAKYCPFCGAKIRV